MKNIKWVVLLILIVFALGFLAGREVYKCAPVVPFSSDTTVTDTTIWTWEYPAYSDTTVPAVITYEETHDNTGNDPEPDTGRNASTTIKYEDGEVLDISYSYDTELFNVRRDLAPRSIQTHFITREIKEYIPIPRAKWDKPGITFGAGCVVGFSVFLLTASALGG